MDKNRASILSPTTSTFLGMSAFMAAGEERLGVYLSVFAICYFASAEIFRSFPARLESSPVIRDLSLTHIFTMREIYRFLVCGVLEEGVVLCPALETVFSLD